MGKPKPEMGKWLLYRFFHKNQAIASYLPETKKYSHKALEDMLERHRSVYVKPVAGSRGRGIIKAWRAANNQIVVKRTTERQQSFAGAAAALARIDRLRDGKMYIVQRGIRLAKVDGRPFDIRVMMQREKPGGSWLYSGMLAKIAGPGSVVTNTALSGGRVMDVDLAMEMTFGWPKTRVTSTVRRLEKLGMEWAKHFDSYQYYRELGFDVAVDENGRIWLIEQNTAPSHALFARNKSNLTAYRRIQYRWGVFERAKRKTRRATK